MMKPPVWETEYYNMPAYWMLISFMTLEASEQLQYFEYPPLPQNDKDYHKPTKNVLLALIGTLQNRDFIDDFDDENITKKDEAFHELLDQCDDTDISYESFMTSHYWAGLRKSAKELLEATKLGFYTDIPKPIEFGYLEELVDPADTIMMGL